MTYTLPRFLAATTTKLWWSALPALSLAGSLFAQQAEWKPAPTPDPVKGMHEVSEMSPAERELVHHGRRPYADAATLAAANAWAPPDRVLFDRPGDGRLWASCRNYKASFGPEGFVYVPFFGSVAPRNFPVQFVVRDVRVGGRALELRAAEPGQVGDRVTFDRGSVREIYDLGQAQVEQTFVVDDPGQGDVDIDLEVVSELGEDGDRPGIQFGNALGQVHYGAAWLVDGASKREIASTFTGGRIRLHVEAALRGPGPVVIDPIIHSSAFEFGGFNQNSNQPDIAYDATSDQYLLVWHYEYSATDFDVYSELRNGNGTRVTNSLGVIDVTTTSHSNPRTANLNAYDRFLVVMQRFEAGRWRIWGRLRLAGAAPHPNIFPISDPNDTGNCRNPDIGGDSADSGPSDQWLVVWEREFSATDTDIHARLVRADTALASGTILIENSSSTIFSLPSISQSNGNGRTGTPRWMIVYQFRFSAADWDIYGAAVAQNGTITTASRTIDTSTASDTVPSVSTPATDFSNGNPIFLVTYERQNPLEARAVLLSAGFVSQIGPINLSQSFGFGPYWVRAESDGNRFAVLSGTAGISVATLAHAGNALVMHEAPQPLGSTPYWPRLCSKRSGGGTRTDYAIAFVDSVFTPDPIWVSAYRGQQPGADITRRITQCGALFITTTGSTALGESVTFTLTNIVGDLPGFVFGLSQPASNSFCAICPIGVASAGAVAVFGPSFTVNIPTNSSYVGVNLAVQGFAFGSGPCLTLRFSDTLGITVR